MGQFGIGLAACLLALVTQLPTPDPLDLWLLPLLAFANLALLLLLWQRRIGDTRAAGVAYVLFASYFLASLNYQLVTYVPERQHYSESTYWFPVIYLSAFIAWRRRAAMTWAVGTFLAAVASIAVHMPRYVELGIVGEDLLGFTAQFVTSGLAAIVLLYHLSVLQQRYGEARLLAYADFLTGLPNRRCGETILEQELRGPGPLTVVLFDLDHFKSVNDLYGHDIGDVVLREAARITSRRVRGKHQVVRWGGEEFLLILPPLEPGALRTLLDALRARLARERVDGVRGVTASFGVAVSAPGEPPERVVARADTAMYAAKARGRDGVQHAEWSPVGGSPTGQDP